MFQPTEAIPSLVLRLTLTNTAAQNIATILASPEYAADTLDDAALRGHAAQQLAALLNEGQPYLVYLRNGDRRRDNDQIVELRFASDVDHAPNNAVIRKLKNRSLVFVGTEKTSHQLEFLLISVNAIPEKWGVKDAWSRLARIEFLAGDSISRKRSGFPPALLAQLAGLPIAKTQQEIISRRLSDWQSYLDILERTARDKQFDVAYQSYRLGQTGRYVTFKLDSSGGQIPWGKIYAAAGEPIDVNESLRLGAAFQKLSGDDGLEDDEARDWLLGTIAEVSQPAAELRVLLDEKVAERLERRTLKLPRPAVLRYKASGDIAQIERLRGGIDSLERGRSENPRLSDFLFDAQSARLPGSTGRIRLSHSQLLRPTLNDGQLAAVEGALNAPDLFLIQGPPGTGKTTVIAEICYQVAQRGGRTLIASQANLAVDNAMSCLVHHPSIRALRRGHADRVEIEGEPYLEENVVSTWLAKTADSCMRDLQARRQRVKMFQELAQNQPRIAAFANTVRAYQQQRQVFAEQITRFEREIDGITQRLEQKNRELAGRRSMLDFLGRVCGQLLQDDAQSALADLAAGPENEIDHPALRQMRTDIDALIGELKFWEPELAAIIRKAGQWRGSSRAYSFQAVVEQCGQADAAAGAFEEIERQVESDRLLIGELYQTVADWYESQATQTALTRERAQLSLARTGHQSQIQASEAQAEMLRKRLDDVNAFKSLALAHPALLGWLEGLPGQHLGGNLMPPRELSLGVGREVWPTALKAAQVSSLHSMMASLHTSQVEAETLARLVAQLAGMIGPLVLEVSPHVLADEGRKGVNWKTSSLSNLVTFDIQGLFHPATGAEIGLRQLNRQLARLLRKPGGLSQLLGAEDRRQLELAHWVVLLRATSTAFSRRRIELEGQSQRLAERIQLRLSSVADNLLAAARQETERLGTQAYKELEAAQAQLDQAKKAAATSSDKIAAIDQQAVDLDQSQAQLLERLGQELGHLSALPPTTPFQELIRTVGRDPFDRWAFAWQSAIKEFDAMFNRLAAASAKLKPADALKRIIGDVESDIARLEVTLAKHTKGKLAAEDKLGVAHNDLKTHEERYAQESKWWQAVHAAIPERLRPANASGDIKSPTYLAALLSACASWDRELQQERAYLGRCEGLVTDWYKRLQSDDPRDSADLRQIYIDNANVIGITCVQAGARHFSREYRNFDCVIIDEVSKATPPELLLPMLKGAKIVLVGDHKQLPPMIGSKAITDLAEELNVPESEVEHLKRSLFKELFEMCPAELRAMLTVQYRMHPQIMQAINQFYADKLKCGIADPDRERAHGCASAPCPPETHIVWVSTPMDRQFQEKKIGTTYSNARELDIIEKIVGELDAAWQAARSDRPKKQVGVITFYAAQTGDLEKMLLDRPPNKSFRNLNIRVGTVDRFQGMERPIVIVSLVRNNSDGDIGFAREQERINVAFSRAKELLIIVGSRELFCVRAKHKRAASIYSRVADVVKRAGGLRDSSIYLNR